MEETKTQLPPNTDGKQPNGSGNSIHEVSTAKEYAAALKKVKEESVPRSEYDKLRAEHSQLIKDVAEGKTVYEADTSKQPTKDISEIKKDILTNKEMYNLDYVKNALELRKQMLEKGLNDPFAPNSRSKATTREELETAQRVADILQECVDHSNGDARLFNSELERRMR